MPQHEEGALVASRLAVADTWTPWGVRPEALRVLADMSRRAAAADLAGVRPPEALARRGEITTVAGGVAVLPLWGLIVPQPSLMSLLFGGGGYGLVAFRDQLRSALADETVSAVLIDVNSPGGRIDLVPEVAAEIREARGTKPIVAIANTMAASAAYWLAAQADEVVVTPSGEAGSIGVFVLHEEFSRMDERIGITTTLIKAGKYKAEGNPFKPLSDEAREAIQGQVDEYYDMFAADVAAGRGVSVAEVREGFAEGRMASARRAVEMKIADHVETFEQAVARLASGSGRRRAAAALAAAREERADQVVAADDLAALMNEAVGRAVRDVTVKAGEDVETADDGEPIAADEPETGQQEAATESEDQAPAETAGKSDNGDESDEGESGQDEDGDGEPAAAELSADDRRRIASVLLG